MRIVSLLPSLTEIVCALGRQNDLVGVTHECDYPLGVERLPHLTRSNIPQDASSAAIDALVVEQRGSLYELDADRLAELRPDLILTQEQCDVCAVNEATVRRSAAQLPGQPTVESVNPIDLAGVFAVFRRVGQLIDASAEAESLIEQFESTSRRIADRRGDQPATGLVILEWVDPPFSSGHWNPEIIDRAGGRELIGPAGEKSRRITWTDLAQVDPEILLISACGFSIERTKLELAAVRDRPEWRALRAVRNNRVAVTDGSAYFSRPGPRLETSLRIAAAIIDPQVCGDLAPDHSWQTFSG